LLSQWTAEFVIFLERGRSILLDFIGTVEEIPSSGKQVIGISSFKKYYKGISFFSGKA
jgi:hypothetical protein